MKCTVEQKDRIVSYKDCCDFVYNGGAIPTGGVHSIWCKRDNIFGLLKQCGLNKDSKYVIVTHESDLPIDQSVVNSIPNNVIKLFGQNVTFADNKVVSIPIGSTCATWVGLEESQYGRYSDQYILIKEDGKEKNFKNLALLDFAIRTNPSHRKPVFDYFVGKDWITEKPCNLSLNEYKNQNYYNHIEEYLRGIYNHKFIISPLGNGVDCGRTWQAIYLGSIPVVPRHLNIEYYDELPILVYDDINEITEEYLNNKWEEMKDKEYNYEKAKLSYWTKRINDAKYE